MTNIKRRDFLKASAALAAASAAGFSCVEIAGAAPIDPPTVDRLQMRVLVDGAPRRIRVCAQCIKSNRVKKAS